MPAEEQRSGGHALWREAVLLATMNLITVKVDSKCSVCP